MARILIIDDDPGVRGVLRRMLARDGHEVDEESDAHRALASLQAPESDPPNVIITDVYMPEMDGIEFLIQLSEVAPEIPAIAISGGGMLGTKHVLEDAHHLGAVATLSKPFTPADVRRVLSEVLPSGE